MYWIKPKLKKKRLEKPIIEKYQWTLHSQAKMRHYHLSPSRIKRIIRYPKRVEEGVAPNTVAVMQQAESKRYEEIWAMYQQKVKSQKSKVKTDGVIKVISAWRYPGKSPARNPIPKDILDEIRALL